MIIVDFKDENYKSVTGLWQWDYGQVLRIQGLNLPKAVEIHFSLQESGGEAKKRVGFTKDGATDVVIPESMLENEEPLGNYDIFAFIYLTDDTSGQTEYKICMPVKARPKPEAFDKPEDGEIFREAIKAVNNAADRAETAEKQAGEYAEQTKADAIKTGEDRTAIAELVESVSGIGEQVQAVKEYKDQAQTAATNALLSEQKSERAKELTLQAQAGAETMADEVEQHALEVAGDKSEVERLATQVRQDKSSVEQTKTAVDKTAQDFTLTAQQALADVNNAGQTQSERVQQVGQDAIADVNTAKKNLDVAISEANTAKSQLSDVITSAGKVKADLSEVITQANTAKTKLDASVTNANQVLQSLVAENTSAAFNIEELRSENFNSQEILAGVADLRAYLGLTADDIVGVQVDYKNKTFKRLAGAANLSKGADFDKFSMFGGRKRCNVADDGSIVAWYGDADYKEDGSMGQVMVYQPKFYYLVCPVEYDPIDTGIGYHLRKANYYVSEKPRAGFRLHPAFYDASGNEIDYILDSAFEGSIWDADGGDGNGAYLMNDEQVMNTGTDKFCSIAGVKPASGLSQNLTRPNVEALAQNRGIEWHGDLIKPVSARQMLMIIELGMMNTQTGVGYGVAGISDNSSYNCSSLTGSTSELGNGSGKATQTINTKGDTRTTETANERVAVSWRGTENPWGNIWKFVYGINIWGNGKMEGGQPYICTDFNFAESKNTGNYEAAGFTVTNANGYISAMGYSTTCDWLFIASECLGNSSLPVGDYTYITVNLNGYRIARLGGRWVDWDSAGGFYWHLSSGVGTRYRYIGGRLVLIPTKDSAVYTANIAAWKQKMAA